MSLNVSGWKLVSLIFEGVLRSWGETAFSYCSLPIYCLPPFSQENFFPLLGKYLLGSCCWHEMESLYKRKLVSRPTMLFAFFRNYMVFWKEFQPKPLLSFLSTDQSRHSVKLSTKIWRRKTKFSVKLGFYCLGDNSTQTESLIPCK
jgi:hypothetical protein